MRRSLLEESELDRVREVAADAGVSLRVLVDLNGDASFTSPGLGTFDDLHTFERALEDVARATP